MGERPGKAKPGEMGIQPSLWPLQGPEKSPRRPGAAANNEESKKGERVVPLFVPSTGRKGVREELAGRRGNGECEERESCQGCGVAHCPMDKVY